jgi:hypothetical protein
MKQPTPPRTKQPQPLPQDSLRHVIGGDIRSPRDAQTGQ